MRSVSAAVVISLSVHAVAIVCLRPGPRAPSARVRVTPRAPAPVPTPPTLEPMIVSIVDLPATPMAASGRGAIARAAHRGAGSTPGTAERSAEGASPSASAPTAPPSVGLSPASISKFLEQTRPVPPADTESGRISDDLATARALLGNPRWFANASPEAVLAMRQRLVDGLDRRDHQELQPAGGGRFTSEHKVHDMNGMERDGFRADVAPDGTVAFHDPRNVQVAGLGGSFDLTDLAMRRHGEDPLAPVKLAWLDKTRDDRVAIGTRHERDVLAHTPQYVERNVEWAWQRSPDPASRKRDLFDLWDECAESGDDAMVAAGATARSYLLGVIRTRLPAGSADAYSAAELAALNAHRQSTQVFAPYVE